MNSLIRSRRIGHLKIPSASPSPSPPPPSPALLRSYHAGRASSVNTAIRRGLRKSKGIGFRGPRKPLADDPREVYRARTGIRPYDFAAAKADSAARREEARSSPQHDRLTGGSSWSSRGREGVKDSGKYSTGRPQQGDAILHSEESGDSEIRGRFGEKLTPRIRKFEQEGNQPGRGSYNKRSFDSPASTSRFGDGPDARSDGRSSRPDYQSRSQNSASKDAYPSLSFRDRSSRSAPQTCASFDKPPFGRNSETKYDASNQSNNRFGSERGPAARFGTTQSYQSARYNGNTSPERTSESFEPRSNRQDRGSTGEYYSGQTGTRASDRTTRLGDDRTSGRTSDAFESRSPGRVRESKGGHFGRGTTGNRSTGSSERSVKSDRREVADAEQPCGKRNDRHSSSTPRVSQVFDKHMPLSIPYTTPASEFLYGTSVVEAAINSRRSPKRKLYKLYIYTGENREDAERDSRLEQLARKNGVEVVRVGNEWIRLMDKMSSGRPHNGYILEASPLPRLPVTHLGEFMSDDGQEGFEVSVDHQSREEAAVNGTSNFIQTIRSHNGRKPLVLLLDSIVDPGNLGGIIRTASFLGVSAIAISARNSASFTPVVLKASAGASENITLFSVNKPAGFVLDSRAAGWRVYAAVAPSKRNDPSMPASLSTDDLVDPLSEAPCILMLGSEGDGLRWNLRSKADVDLYIQGSGQSLNVDSLNVSVATGILCNSFLSKKDGKVATPVAEELSAEEPVREEAVAAAGALF